MRNFGFAVESFPAEATAPSVSLVHLATVDGFGFRAGPFAVPSPMPAGFARALGRTAVCLVARVMFLDEGGTAYDT